jgi:beta-lactamase regulating signal transducer with metallopeptidase domain
VVECSLGEMNRPRASVDPQLRIPPTDAEIEQAFALPGRRGGGVSGRIVVSSGVLRAVDAGERQAVLARERAHLRHRHHRFLIVLRMAAAANPLLRPLSGAGAYAVERWADEDAATVTSRRQVARALGRAALATHRPPPAALGATGGEVPQRVRARLRTEVVSNARANGGSSLSVT